MRLRLEQPLRASPEVVRERLRDPLAYLANPRVRRLRPMRDGFACFEQVGGPLVMPVYVSMRPTRLGVELDAWAPMTHIVGRLTVLEDRLVDELEVRVPWPVRAFARRRLLASHGAMLEALAG